ncbi:MAG: DUF255 domain-containing protein [Nitrospirota bacterium]
MRHHSAVKMTVFLSLLLAAFVLPACAATVDKSEVEQKSNPVKDLHQEAVKAVEAEKDKVQWFSYDDALVKARKENKFVMVDFFAQWCKWCKELDKTTYSDPKVAQAINADFVPVKVDSESLNKVTYEMRQITMSQLADKYSVSSYPTVYFLDKDGKKAEVLNGYLAPDEFLKYLQYIKSGKYKEMKWDDYVSKGAK